MFVECRARWVLSSAVSSSVDGTTQGRPNTDHCRHSQTSRRRRATSSATGSSALNKPPMGSQ